MMQHRENFSILFEQNVHQTNRAIFMRRGRKLYKIWNSVCQTKSLKKLKFQNSGGTKFKKILKICIFKQTYFAKNK